MPDPLRLGFDVPFEDAIAFARARGVTLPDDYYGKLQGAARSHAFTISTLESLQQLQLVLDNLNGAITEGKTFAEWQSDVSDLLGSLTDAHQETVFRNAVQTAYSVGHTLRQRETASTRPFLMWDAINDSRTRETHAAMDNFVAPINDPVWHHWSPPAGFNCRCSRISLTEEQARARGYPMPPRAVNPDAGFDYEKADAVAYDAKLRNLVDSRAAYMPAAIRAAVERVRDRPPAPDQARAAQRTTAVDYVLREGEQAGNGIEYAYAYNANGERIFAGRGEAYAYKFTDSDVAMLRANPGSTMAHNHPSDVPLSIPDILVAREYGMRSMIAVGHRGSLYEAVFGDAAASVEKTNSALLAARGEVGEDLRAGARKGQITDTAAALANYHYINAVASRVAGYDYIARLSPGMQTAVDEVLPVFERRYGVKGFDAVVEALARTVRAILKSAGKD